MTLTLMVRWFWWLYISIPSACDYPWYMILWHISFSVEVSTTGSSWKDCCSEDGSRCYFIIFGIFIQKSIYALFSVWIHTVLNSAPGIAFLGRSSSIASFSLGKLHGNAFNSIFRQKFTVFGTRCDADAGIEEFSASFSKRSTSASYLSSPIILGSRIVCCQDKFLCGRQERRVGRGGNPSFWRLAGGQVHSGGYPLSGSELNLNGSGVFYQRVGHHNPSRGGFG